jgi:lipopolysaccharide biosynthesis glycosyltransferase
VESISEGRCSGPIVFACDGAYAMQLATALRSVAEANQNRWPLDLHVLASDFPSEAQAKVLGSIPTRAARVRWVTVDLEAFRDLSPGEFISKMIFARLLIPQLFPASVSRVLYLDTDVLVLDDLAPLWELDLEGAALGAVLDALDPLLEHGGPGVENMPRVHKYFNSGVLLIDLPRWRDEHISDKAIEFLRLHPRSPFPDQDALNVACDGLWKGLNPRWNFQNHYQTNIAGMGAAERPAVVHFVTRLKPWKPSSLSINASLYDTFRSRTIFARTRRELLRDAVQNTWYRTKRRLRHFPGIRTTRGGVRGDIRVSARD